MNGDGLKKLNRVYGDVQKNTPAIFLKDEIIDIKNHIIFLERDVKKLKKENEKLKKAIEWLKSNLFLGIVQGKENKHLTYKAMQFDKERQYLELPDEIVDIMEEVLGE